MLSILKNSKKNKRDEKVFSLYSLHFSKSGRKELQFLYPVQLEYISLEFHFGLQANTV